MTVSKSLKKLFKTITGQDPTTNTAGDLINELSDNYPAPGPGPEPSNGTFPVEYTLSLSSGSLVATTETALEDIINAHLAKKDVFGICTSGLEIPGNTNVKTKWALSSVIVINGTYNEDGTINTFDSAVAVFESITIDSDSATNAALSVIMHSNNGSTDSVKIVSKGFSIIDA